MKSVSSGNAGLLRQVALSSPPPDMDKSLWAAQAYTLTDRKSRGGKRVGGRRKEKGTRVGGGEEGGAWDNGRST